jgi:spermidine synthase
VDRHHVAPRDQQVACAVSAILWLCFTISGAAALALEMLWMRSAGLVLGQTATTTATVLACYFGGLGLGAAGARGIRWRAVRVYGGLELGAAAGALWSVGVFHILANDSAQRWLAAGGAAGRIGAVAVAVLPATLCLGATLPALGQALAAGAVGRRGGMLYALNTFGGVAGIIAAGFGLPAVIGVRASYAAAAAASALAGIAALLVSRRLTPTPPHTPINSTAESSVSRSRLRIVAAGTGALGLGLEVLWTRLFAQVLHNSVYSFSAIALVFLVAIAAGATVAALAQRRVAPLSIASAALIGAAVATVAGVWLFVRRTDGLLYFGMEAGLGEYVARIVVLAALTAGPAAFASGMVLPALWGAWGGQDGAARPLGDLSAANTFGGIAGAVAAGFLALPILGLRGSLLAVSVAYVVLADVIAPPNRSWRPFAYAALLAVVIANPMRAPLVHLRPDTETLRATVEGAEGIVTVVEADGDLQLRLDNYYVLGGTAAATNERRLGFLPLLLHPAPHRVAFVGLATGITASAAPALGVDDTTVVELVPEVATAARTHFGAWNGHLFDRRDVRVVLDDGRRYLAASQQQFDVIVSDLFIPWHAGAGSLYSREMYQTVAERLAPGGLFCQWLPLYQLTRGEFDMIAHTLLTVFPQVTLWRADFYPNRPVVALVGQFSSQPVDLTRVGDRLARLPAWSQDPLLVAPRALAMLYAGPLTPAADLFAAAPLNTDDRPLLEFNAPRLTRINAAGDKDWFTGEALAAFYDTLATRTAAAPSPLLPRSDEVEQAQRAGGLLYRYALAATAGDSDSAAQLEAQVRALVPEVIQGAESAEAVADLAEARRTLAGLRSEQEQVRRRLEELEQRLGQLDRTGETPQ